MQNKQLREDLSKIVSPQNEDNWWIPELFEKNTHPSLPKELEILMSPPQKEKQYNCFGYALNLSSDPRFLDDKSWAINDDFFKSLISLGLLQKITSPEKGDIVLYWDHGDITHAGIVESDDWVVSKWSWGPLFGHKTWDVPAHYGDKITFYKKPSTEKMSQIIELALKSRVNTD